MKLYKIAAFLIVAGLCSCIKDDSTHADPLISDIEVSGIAESYSIVSYAGEHLRISPVLNSSYNDIEYGWYYYDPDYSPDYNEAGVREYKMIPIADTKDLDYEVNIPPGNYKIVFSAKSSENGYTVYQTADLETTTEFTRGLYIVKETSDGNTDMDMYNSDGVLMTDLISKVYGEPMDGKPNLLGVTFDRAYLVNNAKTSGHTLLVSTEKGDFRYLLSSDLSTVIDRSNLTYEVVGPEEIPYICGTAYFSEVLVTSIGSRSCYVEMWGAGTAFQGSNVGTGGSGYAVNAKYIFYYWNPVAGSFDGVDYNGSLNTVAAARGTSYKATGLTDLTPVACGFSNVAPYKVVYVMEDKSGKRFLYEIDGSGFSIGALSLVTEIPSSMSLASSDCIGVCYSAAMIYSYSNGKLYGYNLNDHTETELALTGLPSGETVNYVAHDYWNGYDRGYTFSNLVIGTQKGDSYNLYFYDIVGGQPNGAPVNTISGTGKVRSIKYMSPAATFSDAAAFPTQG